MSLHLTAIDGNTRFKVFYQTSELGLIYMEVDGFYVFLPLDNSGSFNEFSLRLIADKLEELNYDWNKYLEETLK